MCDLIKKYKELISKNKVKQVVENLLLLFIRLEETDPSKYEDIKSLHNCFIMLSARICDLEYNIQIGILTKYETQIEQNKINNSLIALIDEFSKISIPIDTLTEVSEIDIANGIIPINIIQGANHKLPGEVFASELLQENILIKLTPENETQIVINRNNISSVLISNTGKKHLFETYVKPNKIKIAKADDEIHHFILEKSKNKAQRIIDLKELNLPLRWLSGGVLSIVEFKGRKWIPFFFRDIKPYGWNISLGSSERQTEFGNEYNSPWELIVREFLEETFILDTTPELGGSPRFKRFYFDILDVERQSKLVNKFAADHIKLRQNEDMLRIINDKHNIDFNLDINVQTIPTNTRIDIINPNEINRPLTGILVSFNLLELGIEVVKVFKYNLNEHDYLLDGEILEHPNGIKELVRMPCALISYEYLQKNFGKSDFTLQYTEDEPPSINASTITKDDIHIFDWDIKRRWQILNEKTYKGSEKVRFTKWSELFGKYFEMDKNYNLVNKEIINLFTPASAKIIQYYFTNI